MVQVEVLPVVQFLVAGEVLGGQERIERACQNFCVRA